MILFRNMSCVVAVATTIAATTISAAEPQTAKSLSTSVTQKAHFLWGIDHLSKCTFLQRKSGIRRVDRYREGGSEEYNVFVLMSADGRTEESKSSLVRTTAIRSPFAP